VSTKPVGLSVGVFSTAGVWVNSETGSGVRVLNRGMDGRLVPGRRAKTISKTPPTAKTPRLENALRARIVFC
jgi:hypothetical protein